MADVTLQPLPPKEAVDYFRSKGLQESFAWQDIWQEEHARAFTVAKAMSRDVLVDIRQAVDQAIAEGTTLEQFRSSLQPLLEAKGWWGRKAMVDPLTGKEREVQLGSPRRLRTIFDTNLRTAYAAGGWQRIQATKAALPYLLYHHTAQSHPRPEHQAWGSQPVCLPVDHPWWQTHYPPNGWGCKCFVTQLSKRMMDRRGLVETERPIKFPLKSYSNPRTGEVTAVEQGIDPGWSYNVGEAYLAPLTPRPAAGLGAHLPGPPPERPPLEPPRAGPPLLQPDELPSATQSRFLAAFGANSTTGVVFTDAGGEPFVASAALFQDAAGNAVALDPNKRRAIRLAAQTIRYPDEIRWVWREGPAGALLTRRYVARISVGSDVVGVVVDASAGSSANWAFATSLDAGFDLEALRVGDLAWRRATTADIGMTAAERAALQLYTGSAYKQINGHLRHGDYIDDEELEAIEHLDTLLARASLPRDMTLHRVISGEYATELEDRGLDVGDFIHDEGYLSTSRDPHASARFDEEEGSIHLVIRARGFDRALDVSPWSTINSEHEILFARGTALRVVSWDDETRTLTVETVR